MAKDNILFPKTSISTDLISVHQFQNVDIMAPNLINKNVKQLINYWVKSSNVDNIQRFSHFAHKHFFLKTGNFGRETLVGMGLRYMERKHK